jgi:biofilm PGA synthesis N-glycosyltransferase PgaC
MLSAVLTGAFAACAALVAYNYVLYPALVIALARLKPAATPPSLPADRGQWPSVSFIIAAYNEERVIADKIRNTLAIDYPAERLEVIVVSDGSNDATPTIAASFADRGVCSLHDPPRRGKSSALNRGVARAGGEIVVFSDANNDFAPGALQALVRHFAVEAVGGVCGVKQIKPAADRQSTQGDGLYWRYESAIKAAEGRLGSITNADGEIFALRRRLYRPLDERVINDDTQVTFDLVSQGFRVLYEPEARSYEYASRSIRDDFFVKVRMVAGGYQSLAMNAAWFLPPRRAFTLAFLSHKALRWLAPLPLAGLFACSAALAARPFFTAALAAQLAFYATAAWGARAIARRELPGPAYVAFYFSAMNLAALLGLWRFLRGRQGTSWRKAAR